MANGLIRCVLFAQTQYQNATIVITPLLPHDIKSSLSRDINVINTFLLSECLKYNLYFFKHQIEWLYINRSLDYKVGPHLIKNGNKLLEK